MIKLSLEPQELDVVMKHLQVGQWQHVQGVINKIIAQANDATFQSTGESNAHPKVVGND